MKRIYHPYKKWEEFHAGMWRSVSKQERDMFLTKAIKFTGNTELYGKWMMKVIKNWKFSCEHNLTDTSMNRQAWIGHAACCMAIKCPEDITRLAWHQLTQIQQDKANLKADKAILKWEKSHAKKISRK